MTRRQKRRHNPPRQYGGDFFASDAARIRRFYFGKARMFRLRSHKKGARENGALNYIDFLQNVNRLRHLPFLFRRRAAAAQFFVH